MAERLTATEHASSRKDVTLDQGTVVPDPRTLLPESSGARIVFASGTPARGAELTWTPVIPILLASTWDWDEIELAWYHAATTRGVADSHGFANPKPPALDQDLGSIVWVDLDGHEPLFDVLGPETASLEGLRYELKQAESVGVLVQDGDGNPVEGATVEQHGVDLRVEIDASPHVPLLFRRSRATEADGTCWITRFPGRQAVVAEKDGLVSRPIVVMQDQDQVVLRLCDSFRVFGTVNRPSSPDVIGEIVPRITLGAQLGNIWRELGTAVSRSDGSWGPLTVPWEPETAGSAFRAQVHGVAVVTSETIFPTPKPGEDVVLHLDAQVGTHQWFMGFDREVDVPLLGTKAVVLWEENGSIQSVASNARTDGYVSVLGIRPGPVRATLSRPGYTTAVFPGLDLPEPEPRTLTAVMKPAVPVSGRVTRDGDPVPDFELTYWPSYDVSSRCTRSFQDRLDGTFVLDDVAAESLGIAASAPGAPGSEPLQVDVPPEGMSGVEIALVGAIFGSGRVVAKEDGQPILEAIVQPHVLGAGSPVAPWGPPLFVGPGGKFEEAAFREGENYLLISATGFATQSVFAASTGNRVDFGVIEMLPAVELRIEIVSPAEGIHRITTRGTISRSTTDFERDADGLLVGWLHDMPAGKHMLELTYPDTTTTFQRAIVEPGVNAVRFRGGSGSIVVHLSDPPEPDYDLGVELYDEQGRWEYRMADFSSEGTARLAGLPAGDARVYLRDQYVTLASTKAVIRAGEETQVQLTVGKAELLLRVLDSEKDPVAGASVRLLGTDVVKERDSGVTNERGEYLFRALTRARYLLHVRHPALGLLPDVEVDVDSEDRLVREVVLDGRASLDLQVLDGDVLLPGITCRLLDRADGELTAAVLTNDEGRATFSRLTPGSYRLQVTNDSIWPLEVQVEVQPGAGLRPTPVRRLGDLKLRVLNPEGVPVSGAEVGLTCTETGEEVETWLKEGRVPSPGLLTDNHGEVLLSGLPRGAYTWRTGGSEGVLLVQAAKETLVLIAIQ